MFIAPKTMSAPQAPPLKYWPEKSIKLNGGLDLADQEFQLPDNKTNKVLNVWFKNDLDKRWGQDWLKSDEVPENICYSTYKYIFKGYIIKHCGTKLYKQDPSTGVITSIYSGLTAATSKIFKYNGKLYLKQVGKYIQWDGTTASAVVPYIPTVIINRTPTGGGNTNEGYNRLGAGFKNSFNGNGSATAYQLTDTVLDSTAVTATIGGVAKTEGVDFTVNRTTGVVTFSVAPASGTNNVIITAYKTIQADIDSILNCLSVRPFGGQNDNRLFFGNNGTGYYYWTGISTVGIDPTYFPYNNYNIVGLTDENITGFGRFQNSLLVIKEREVFAVDYSWNGTTGVFNSYPVNDAIGCNCPDTIQTVNNNTVWLSTEFGVCLVQGTSVGNQRNIFTISRNVDARLLKESNLTSASSVDFDGKYWLCVNDKVYLWDYFLAPYYDTGNPDENAKRLSWWYFDNINASSWVVDGDDLYYGHRANGKTVKFHTTDDAGQYYDFGAGYNAVYRYPFRLIGQGLYEFSILKGYIGVRGDRKTSYTVTYFTSDAPNGESETEDIQVGSFSLANYSLAAFTLGVMGPLFNWVLIPALKNIQFFAVEFSNSEAGKALNISSMLWEYRMSKKIK